MNRLVILLIASLCVVASISAQTLTEAEVVATMNNAFALHKEKKYSEALSAFLTVGANTMLQRTKNEQDVYVCSQVMACQCYELTGQYENGYRLAKKLIDGKPNDSMKKEVYNLYVLNGYLHACSLARAKNVEYSKARELLLSLLPYADEDMKKKILARSANLWYFEGAYYYLSLKFDEALNCFKKALDAFRQLGNAKDELYVLEKIASTQYEIYSIYEAIDSYEQALLLSQQLGNTLKQMEIAKELFKLHGINGNMDEVAKCATLIESIKAETYDAMVLFEYYCHKGKVAYNQGSANLAEQWFLKGMAVADSLDEKNAAAAKSLLYIHFRDLYVSVGRYEEALKYAQLALDRKIDSFSYSSFYLPYSSLLNIYSKMGDRENCFANIDTMFMIEPNITEPRELSKLYTTRALCHQNFKDYQSALDDYKKADEILASKYSASNGERVSLYALMGGIEHKLEHYDESERYYKLYADVVGSIYGKENLKYINALIYLANAQGFAGNIEHGCNNYTIAMHDLKRVVGQRLPYMDTSERDAFWQIISELLTKMTPYALKAGLFQTEYTKNCYDALVLSKAFLLDSERSLYDIVKREGTYEDMQTYASITHMNNKIKMWEKNYSLYADSILAYSNNVSNLENALLKRCKSIGDLTSFMEVDYEMVKGALKRNDVVVDFTDFVSQTDGRRYAAYIVDKRKKYPLLMPLFRESQIDSLGIVRPDMFYDNDYAPDVVKLLWDPIKEHIPEGATVYYIPSQLLFQVSLESLPLEDGTLLGEHYNFVRLSSARELVKRKKHPRAKAASAVLYGGLQYDIEPKLMADNAMNYDLSSLTVLRGGDIVRGEDAFCELPGTKVEVEKISEILRRNKFDVKPYMGKEGTEESFWNMHRQSPRILHLATHGFYFTPSEASEIDYLKGHKDAMQLSGLIMSGGNAVWTGKEIPDGVLGGVLTASNIARLDLSNTDMVVLSACQTGLGSATSEGLYGLQRAFKKAGAGAIMMTLWKVEDKMATEFMVKFYEHLVACRWDKHKAFKKTQSEIRDIYPSPEKWAAFVLLD